jgi:hypothetical protein
MNPLLVFNTLQERFGRPLKLEYLDNDSLIFRVPWWGNFEFSYGLWNGKFEQRQGAESVENANTDWLEDLINDRVRDAEGNMRPRISS